MREEQIEEKVHYAHSEAEKTRDEACCIAD